MSEFPSVAGPGSGHHPLDGSGAVMPRRIARASRLAVDLSVLGFAFALSFLLRFDGAPPASMIGRAFLIGPYVIALEYFVLVAFGVHRFAWRYVGLREVVRIGLACAAATVALIVARLALRELQDWQMYLRHGVIPFGVIVINGMFSFLGIVGVRVLRRLTGEARESGSRARPSDPAVPTMLVGAGQAGVLIARELASRPDLGLKPIGFLDDDPAKTGMVIYGIPVLGTTADLPGLCARHNARQALITIANAPGSAIRRIRELCEAAQIPTKIVPGVYEILGGKVNLSRIRNVAIEDLLRRDPVDLELEAIATSVGGRVVMTTGAGGSIGSELCRQICRFGPQRLVLLERSENNLFQIHRELFASHPGIELVPCVGDITDEASMAAIFAEHRPSVVFHAAAHKHVPMMEWNPVEAIQNNVFGTRVIADLAVRSGVEAFVMISTDKAVNPSSVMGASKRAAEMYVQALSSENGCRFVTVRFGNVLASAGSVVPIFQEQIERGGPVTVTHPDMRRYFMTIPEACQLVLQASSMGEGGEIFILDMGEPVKIVDLARDLIELSGFHPGEDIEIVFSGVRDGEKLFEELSTDSECAVKTRHPKIFIGRIGPLSPQEVKSRFKLLEAAVADRDTESVIKALRRVIPEYKPSSGQPPPTQGTLEERMPHARVEGPLRVAHSG